jgi:O-antigen/teichoic acid export membrane protein
VIFNNERISELLEADSISFWLYFVPLTVLITGIYNVLNYLNNRKKLYKDLAKANVYRSTAGAVVQLVIGFVKEGVSGLITGQIISFAMANIKLTKNTISNYDIKSIGIKSIKKLGRKYVTFPKYTVWATLANQLSKNFVSVFIPVIYSMTTLGFYSLVQRVLAGPASIIGGAIGQVFHQEVSREKILTGAGVKTFNKTIKKLLLIGIPFFLIMYFIIEDIFVLVFGDEWKLAGEFAKILVPLFFIRFVIGTVSIMNSVFLKNKNGLIFQMCLMTMSLIALYISNFLNLSAKAFFEILTSLLCVTYILFGFYLNRLKYGVVSK